MYDIKLEERSFVIRIEMKKKDQRKKNRIIQISKLRYKFVTNLFYFDVFTMKIFISNI